MLSDDCAASAAASAFGGLNAPFGAQCFPTAGTADVDRRGYGVSMHLLVLSAFRHGGRDFIESKGLPVSMHLLVLSAFRLVDVDGIHIDIPGLNAPFGAQCFPTESGT